MKFLVEKLLHLSAKADTSSQARLVMEAAAKEIARLRAEMGVEQVEWPPRFGYDISRDQYTMLSGDLRVALPDQMTGPINGLLKVLHGNQQFWPAGWSPEPHR